MNENKLKDIGKYFIQIFSKWDKKPFIKEKKSLKTLTYHDFFIQTQKIVSVLKNEGVKQGEMVILSMDNSISSLIIFFASLISGIIPIVIPWKNKTDELRYILKATNAVAFFHSSGKQKEFQDALNIPVFDVKKLQILAENIAIQLQEICSEEISAKISTDIAYIIFTTGTTGTPKKVAVSHLNMLEEIRSMAEAYGFVQEDRHMCILPIYHASGLYRGILLPFHTGGFIFLDEAFDIENFWKNISTDNINFVQVVPSILKKLLQQEDTSDPLPSHKLKYIGSASAPHPVDLIKSFEARFGIYIRQGYGMTEATCGITLDPLDKRYRKLGSVGKPLSVNQVKILNNDNEILISGQSGRVFVYGNNIAIFDKKPSPVLIENIPCGKMLDTGDIGHLDKDGFLWLESRNADLIKRGGYRMSSTEIEAAITEANPDIELAVLGVPHALLGQDVVAFIVKGKTDCKALDIIRSIKGKIASYKLPTDVIFIDVLPMIGVGKVDKKELQKLFFEKNKTN